MQHEQQTDDHEPEDRLWEEKPRGGRESATVEALLFVSPGPLSAETLSELTCLDMRKVKELVEELKESYSRREGGLVIREVAGGYGIYATPDAAPYISKLIKSQVNPRLTRAALETLAITAYLQPVSRSVIAELRGVQSEGVIKTLEERGLVRPVGKGGPPGYPTLYGTTNRFLERFGLKSTDDLPPLDMFAPDQETVSKIERSLSWELMEGDIGATGGETREDTEDPGEGGDSLSQRLGGADPVREGHTQRGAGEAG